MPSPTMNVVHQCSYVRCHYLHSPHAVRSFLFWPLTRKEKIFSLCELCVSSEAGGEKHPSLTRLTKVGPSRLAERFERLINRATHFSGVSPVGGTGQVSKRVRFFYVLIGNRGIINSEARRRGATRYNHRIQQLDRSNRNRRLS